MHFSTLLGKTLRDPPSEAHLVSHQLLVRAALVRSVAPGLFAYLPLGQRALDRLRGLVARELGAAGGQEITLPLVPGTEPAAVLVGLAEREVDSYRQLPLLVFYSAALLEPEPAIREGLFGAGERPAVAIQAFEGEGLAEAPQRIERALARILDACDVTVIWAGANAGSQRAYLLHPAGDEVLAHCRACDYAAKRSWAAAAWPAAPDEPALPPEEVETPGCNTIATLAAFLDIPESKTLKMVFYSVEGDVTCVVIRGDRSVDEAKLARMLGTDWYYASMEHELEAVGAVGGYASPIGLDQARLRVVADPSVRSGANFVSGANRPDYHLKNVNVPRDFEPGAWVDLALVEAGDACPACGGPLVVEPAFALIEKGPAGPCEPGAEYLDAEGRGQPLWMAGWRLDLGRLLAAVAEGHRDEYGLLWPRACAPFEVHLVALDLRREEVAAQAGALYERLRASGLAVLFDDRDASAGVKFNDADLIGIPLRLTVGKRTAQEGLVEAKWRDSAERLKLDEEGLAAELARLREE